MYSVEIQTTRLGPGARDSVKVGVEAMKVCQSLSSIGRKGLVLVVPDLTSSPIQLVVYRELKMFLE